MDLDAIHALRDMRPDLYADLRHQGSRVMTKVKTFQVGAAHSTTIWTNVMQSSIIAKLLEFIVLNAKGLLTDGLFPWISALCVMQFYLHSDRAISTLLPIVWRVLVHRWPNPFVVP